MKSPAVLESALQHAGVSDLKCIRAESVPLIWLSRNVLAYVSRNEHPNMERSSDWLAISVSGVDAEETSTLVGAVTQANVAME